MSISFAHILLVAAGGAVGSALRFVSGSLFPAAPREFPVTTLLINLVGSFVLGALAALASRQGMISREMMLLLATGLCGGFTTFSTFSVETMNLIHTDQYLYAIGYVALSCAGGVAMALAGYHTARLLVQ